MTTKCIGLENPFDGRRKATLVTDDKVICEYLAKHQFDKVKLDVFILSKSYSYPNDEVRQTPVIFIRDD